MNNDSKPPISNMTSSLSHMSQITSTLQSSISSYNSSTNQGSKQSLNNPNFEYISKSIDDINLPLQYIQF
ncbi:unnamed protein product, partial [Rotaria sp. Silwood2]